MNPFRIAIPAAAPFHQRAALTAARPVLDWILGLPTYRQLYRRAVDAPGTTFAARALHALEIDVHADEWAVDAMPPSGPLVIVANHPHGMLDGLALAHLASQRRPDVRVLTSHLLSAVPDLAALCLFVDPFGGEASMARSRGGLRAAKRWLLAGHALVVFPAGSVAHERRTGWETPRDGVWHTTAARLAHATGAAVVPAFIHGGNSRWFSHAGLVHERLRTLLLGRELLRRRGTSVTVRLGPVELPPQTAAFDPVSATTKLRRDVEQLDAPASSGPSREAIDAEIAALGPDALLVRSGRFDVFCAAAPVIPNVLRELGRLRELTFRSVGEGTGRDIDLDRFDGHYLHLFVWNREAREIAGAYRLGLADEIVAAHGVEGLYTSTLFRYDARLLERLTPAIELGRSFVRAEYQRSSNALLLLWTGIARFVARSKKYRVLFGPVSISSRYADMSQLLLREFLTQNCVAHDLAALCEATNPPAAGPGPQDTTLRGPGSLRDLDRLVSGLEPDGKGVPVLLRHYLKLNAKLLGFNVDPDFADALDALMMVDLADVSPAILRRYFGDDAALFVAARRAA